MSLGSPVVSVLPMIGLFLSHWWFRRVFFAASLFCSNLNTGSTRCGTLDHSGRLIFEMIYYFPEQLHLFKCPIFFAMSRWFWANATFSVMFCLILLWSEFLMYVWNFILRMWIGNIICCESISFFVILFVLVVVPDLLGWFYQTLAGDCWWCVWLCLCSCVYHIVGLVVWM